MSDQAQRIGELYARCLRRYDDFGTFQMALSNSMSYRPYNWDIDQFERVLTVMDELETSTNPPRQEDWETWDERIKELRD